VRLRVVELRLQRLPAELDGVRIGHLSDFHLGVPSRGRLAVERGVDWVAERRPDLVCVTGDLVSRPAGEQDLRALLGRFDHPWLVLGNHDHAWSRDPFSRPVAFEHLGDARLLADESVEIELRGRRVELAGVNPLTWLRRRPSDLPPSDADLRILLCHFPRVLDRVPPGRFDLVLAGHLHAGQIVLPYGRGKLLLAHPRAPYTEGIYEHAGTVMHVSPGLGTTFLPLRFFARPEATELVLRSGSRFEAPVRGAPQGD
jgi:predicted MPP superfamily phosphohydrolase